MNSFNKMYATVDSFLYNRSSQNHWLILPRAFLVAWNLGRCKYTVIDTVFAGRFG
jgi:hypothetical protein